MSHLHVHFYIDTSHMTLEGKLEMKRKYELLLRMYEEVSVSAFLYSKMHWGRIESIKESTRRYKEAGRAALDTWLEYIPEPKPDHYVLYWKPLFFVLFAYGLVD